MKSAHQAIEQVRQNCYKQDWVIDRTETHKDVQFEFLGFSYQPRPRKSKRDGKTYTAYAAEISRSNQKRIREVIKSYKGWKHPCVTTDDIARYLNPKLRGWINYYGKYSKKKLWRTLQTVDLKLINRFMKLHKTGFRQATKQLLLLKRTSPGLFYHWKAGY